MLNLRKIKIVNAVAVVCIATFSVFSVFADDEIPKDEFSNIMQDDANYDKALSESAIVKPKTVEKKTAPVKAELSGLSGLSDFNDIAVINKKFLPKTKRFEFYPNLGMIINDTFFLDFVYSARFGFYFAEKYGLELIGNWISSSSKSVTSELAADHAVATTSLVTPQSYYGLDFKWSPIYGKMGFVNKKIIPFDFYLSLGGGMTATNQGTSAGTGHFGLGQNFALSKWMAFRWDISWFGYSSTTKSLPQAGSSFYTNIYANLGVSIFFPGAEYR